MRKSNSGTLTINTKRLALAASVGALGLLAACSGGGDDGGDDQAGAAAISSQAKALDLPADYEAGTESDKQAALWTRVTQTDYKGSRATWPANVVGSSITNLFAADSPDKATGQLNSLGGKFLRQSFETASDEQPFVSPGIRRRKLVHNLGSAVKVELVPVKGSPYSGLFQGAIGIARLSLAAKPFREPLFGRQLSKLTPGVAMKLFVDHKPSVNLHAMPGVDGIEGFEYFARPFSNAIGDPQGAATKILGDIFQNAITPAPGNHMGINGFATVDRTGKAPDKVKAPAQIFLVGTAATKGLEGQSEDVDFRVSLEKIPQGPIFEVFALESGNVITDPAAVDAALSSGKLTKIATINATSKVISSGYEDDRLFFNHQKFEK